MLRHYKRFIAGLALLALCFAAGFLMFLSENQKSVRTPASLNEVSPLQMQKAVLSVSIHEFQDSKPVLGRSYFDQVFSENGQYQVPFPFSKVLDRLADYTGQKVNSSSGIKVVLLPMGRSLQRNAAFIEEPTHLKSASVLDPFFLYPRIVVGIDEEPSHENALLLNLKNKLYLGFNEKAQVIEAISYNDELGRYEYQVVQNYADGKSANVIYANRSLCLSCHQNQAPIFSRGPWSETNANPAMAERLQNVFDQTYGKATCSPTKSQTYCYQDKMPFYFGAPVHIESNVTRQLDTSTDLANLTHAYQRMWKEFCKTDECRITHLQSALLYRLTAQEGLRTSPEVKNQSDLLESNFRQRYPLGWSIPSPDIPDRDPLKDVQLNPAVFDLSTVSKVNRAEVNLLLSTSRIPNAFEPLLPRAPVDVWTDTARDESEANRLIRGFAQEFTLADIKLIDQWLKTNRSDSDIVTSLTSLCDIQKEKSALKISCNGSTEESFSFAAVVDLAKPGERFKISEFNYKSKNLNCKVSADDSCLQVFDLDGSFAKISESQSRMNIYFKNGLGFKNSEAFDLSEVQIDLDAKIAQLKVRDPVPFLQSFLKVNIKELFPNTVFKRFHIMKLITSASGQKLVRQQDETYLSLPLHLNPTFAAEELEQQMNGFTIMKNVCAQCHQSNETTPAHFMGTLTQPSNDFEMCRQIEQCAPRMIYRLKMRQCANHDNKAKKNAMPPAHFFKDEASLHLWSAVYSPKVIKYLTSLVNENHLKENFINQGVNETQAQISAADILKSDCPDSDSTVYDQLPKCEFNKLKPFITMTRCR